MAEDDNSNGESIITQDPQVIRSWAEERGGKPAKVKGTQDPGIIRINFPGGAEDSLEDISWDEFFDAMKQRNLAFLYQNRKANGEMSTFFKLVDADKGAKDEDTGAAVEA